MNRKYSARHRIIAGFWVLLCLGVFVFRVYRGGNGSRQKTVQFAVFNTMCSIRVWKTGEVEPVLAELMANLQKLHECINAYDPKSELSRLNNEAGEREFPCSPQLWECLRKGREAYELTEGAFDISVGPLMKLWGFHGKRKTIPTEQEVQQALEKVGLDKVVFDDEKHTVRFTVKQMYLDFGGIAKGIACDLAVEFLRQHGIEDFLLDFGGNLRISERNVTVDIRDPNGKGYVCSKKLRNTTVATSGNYERSRLIDGKRVGHIMNPKTGRPGEFFLSVSAITPNGALADALSTAVFVEGEPLARRVIARLPNTSFVVVREDGTREEWK